MVKRTLTKLTTTSLAVKRSTSLAVKPFISLAVHKLSGQTVHKLCGQAVHKLCGQAFNKLSCKFFIERLCSGMWSGPFSVLSPPIPYFSFFHCFISVMGAWNGVSWLGCGDLPAMGGSILFRGWLATMEAPGYPSHPPST